MVCGKIPLGFVLAYLSTATVKDIPDVHVRAVTASLKSKQELAAEHAKRQPALGKAFADSRLIKGLLCFTVALNAVQFCHSRQPSVAVAILPKPRFRYSREPGPLAVRCIVPPPLFEKKIDQQVETLFEREIFEKRTSAWGNSVTIVSKTNGFQVLR